MLKSFAVKSSLVAGLATIGALLLAPQEAAAGFHGFHGGGAHISIARPAFHPAFRPAFHPVFRTAAHFAPRRVSFGGYRPIRSAGLVRHGRDHEYIRLGRLEHERGRHVRLPGGGYAPAFYQPDYAEPEAAVVPTVTPAAVAGPEATPAVGGSAPSAASQAQVGKTESCGATGSSIQVAFAPKATASDISNFLKAYNVTIVDGPNAEGRYRVRLSDKALPPNEVMQAVQSMQSQTAIVSAVSVL